MNKSLVRRFEVGAGEYVVFRFTLRRDTSLYVRMYATNPANVLLLDSGNYAEYKSGIPDYHYTKIWSQRIQFEDEVSVWAGTWYIVVEGRDQTSGGWLEVFH